VAVKLLVNGAPDFIPPYRAKFPKNKTGFYAAETMWDLVLDILGE